MGGDLGATVPQKIEVGDARSNFSRVCKLRVSEGLKAYMCSVYLCNTNICCRISLCTEMRPTETLCQTRCTKCSVKKLRSKIQGECKCTTLHLLAGALDPSPNISRSTKVGLLLSDNKFELTKKDLQDEYY